MEGCRDAAASPEPSHAAACPLAAQPPSKSGRGKAGKSREKEHGAETQVATHCHRARPTARSASALGGHAKDSVVHPLMQESICGSCCQTAALKASMQPIEAPAAGSPKLKITAISLLCPINNMLNRRAASIINAHC